MHPLVLITSNPAVPPLIAPLAAAWELELVVAPTWADGSTRPHHGLFVYDPWYRWIIDPILAHPLPLLLCAPRWGFPSGGQRWGTLEQQRHTQHIVAPFDHQDAYLLGLRILFRDRWPRGTPLPAYDALPAFPDMSQQWVQVVAHDQTAVPPQPPT
ncbi:MAG TPA: hypothetical protein VGE07_22910 [Herpetosiphonaceae bacterium]